jgi:tetratricopeptide (TPR) repeat protein
MTLRRVALGGLAVVVAAGAALLGGTLTDSAGPPPARAVPTPAAPALAERVLAGVASGSSASVVARLERDVRSSPDPGRLALLGLAYQQRWRETGDAGFLTRSETALQRALGLAPRDVTATAGLASLALARHEFREALELAGRARRVAPHLALLHGLVGDALVELGRYDEAFRSWDRLATLKPGLAAYARVAHGRELLGRPRDALHALELAVAAARGQAEPSAWAHAELGNLRWSLGDAHAAADEYRAALASLPGYPYALDGLARTEAAAGRYGRAIELARQVVESVPLPQFAATLGDLYRVTGRERLARRQYALVRAIERLLAAQGVRGDLELALFHVDRGIGLKQALERARRARAQRPSIDGDDLLAWALARNGRCEEARIWSKRALRLGTQDAAKLFHRGMIERCLGRDDEARSWFRRALDTNPNFSLLWAPVARRYSG